MTKNSNMNKYNFVYRQISPNDDGIDSEFIKLFESEITLDSYRVVFKRIRHIVKPCFKDNQIKYNNVDGVAARDFNTRIGRFRSDWLELELADFTTVESDYLTDEEILNKRLLQETEIADFLYWENKIVEEVSHNTMTLLVGLEYISDNNSKHKGMQLGGLRSESWPAKFKIFEFIITNSPTCVFIQNRANVLL